MNFDFKKDIKNNIYKREIVLYTNGTLSSAIYLKVNNNFVAHSVGDKPSYVEYNIEKNKIIEKSWHNLGSPHRTYGPSAILLCIPASSYSFIALYYYINGENKYKGTDSTKREILYQEYITDDLDYLMPDFPLV